LVVFYLVEGALAPLAAQKRNLRIPPAELLAQTLPASIESSDGP
jgi:hypothetical protein